jgi:hypothetical protein
VVAHDGVRGDYGVSVWEFLDCQSWLG